MADAVPALFPAVLAALLALAGWLVVHRSGAGEPPSRAFLTALWYAALLAVTFAPVGTRPVSGWTR